MVASVRCNKGYNIAKHITSIISGLDHPFPEAFFPKHTSFVRTSSTRFASGSTFVVNTYLKSVTIKSRQFREQSPIDYVQAIKLFRACRNQFINHIAKDVMTREQNFWNAMNAKRVRKLTTHRGLEGNNAWKEVASTNYGDDKPQYASSGVTWNWADNAVGHKCLKCYHLHRFCELPGVDGTVATTWLSAYKPCNCSEALAVAILEGRQAGF
jgi:hypothetical protein